MRKLVCVAVIGLFGCDQGAKSADAECGATAAAMIKALQSPDVQMPKDVHKTLTNRCADDRWTPTARDCLKQLRAYEDLEACSYKHLTRQQDELLQPIIESFDTGAAEVVARVERSWTKMCACADRACAEAVSAETRMWFEDFGRKRRETPRMNAEQRDQLNAITEQLSKCSQRAMGITPSADPMSTR